MNVFDEIAAALARGEEPTVTLSLAHLSSLRSTNKGGRPKKQHYSTHETTKVLGYGRHLCVNPACLFGQDKKRRKRLTKEQFLVCSDLCRDEAMRYFQTMLDLLQRPQAEPVKDVPNVDVRPISRDVRAREKRARSKARNSQG